MADSITLVKGGNVNITKDSPGLVKVTAGGGWDTNAKPGEDFDLDLSLVGVKADDKVRNNNDLLYFGHKDTEYAHHTGDNLTGEGEGDDERIEISLDKVPADIEKIILFVNIYEAASRGQNFGQVNNAYVRLFKTEGEEELAKIDLSEDFSTETSVVLGELYRHGGEWKFKNVEQGYAGGLKEIAAEHGVSVG